MIHDAVVGIISRDQLPNVLTLIHRAGLGPQARVLDPERGDLPGQLTRAGLVDPPVLDPAAGEEMVLVVFSAGRMPAAIAAMEQFGGRDIQTLSRRTSLALPTSPSRAMPARRGRRRPYRPGAPGSRPQDSPDPR
jgi:hypothetical protein